MTFVTNVPCARMAQRKSRPFYWYAPFGETRAQGTNVTKRNAMCAMGGPTVTTPFSLQLTAGGYIDLPAGKPGDRRWLASETANTVFLTRARKVNAKPHYCTAHGFA